MSIGLDECRIGRKLDCEGLGFDESCNGQLKAWTEVSVRALNNEWKEIELAADSCSARQRMLSGTRC